MGYNFTAIEKKWQRIWAETKAFRALDPQEAGNMPKMYVLDMFPYPSGAGLHVGHPEGYTATDIVSRYYRMRGFNVMHPMGWDAFGLPAEQYAIKTNTHPRKTTETNIDNFRRQIQMLGLSYDWDREVDTTAEGYYRWTQWIFLQLFNSYFDPVERKAKPVSYLLHQLSIDNYVVGLDGSVHLNPQAEGLEAMSGRVDLFKTFKELTPEEQRATIDGLRLAYTDEIPVNWCPGLGTVLANEEVIDGKSEVGGFPVERRPLRQWMLRITAYADRLLDDLNGLDWSESLKEMQRNWIGRSIGAEVDFEIDGKDASVTVFTTRPDTLYGATYLVLAPEHALVDAITSNEQKAAVVSYRAAVAGRSERDRMEDVKEKTGVFTGAYAINPVNGEKVPVWVADYVLMGYGTGAIMAVPAHDDRDYSFARKFGLPIVQVVRPVTGAAAEGRAFTDEGVAVNSPIIDGLPTGQAKEKIIATLERDADGRGTVKYKLRDWLFSRQRYWGEPFPILLDAAGNAYAVPESELPVKLPEMADFKPSGTPEPPLSKAQDWVRYSDTLSREVNTMPQWAGSCWYYLRYLDPKNTQQFVDPAKEKYWMPVDLYVGGVEHAVLHLLYARFWHKVLFDLGHVSTTEPFQRLVNQGLILGEMEYHFFEMNAKAVSVAEFGDISEEASPQGPKLAGTHKATGQRVFATRVEDLLVETKKEGVFLKANPAVKVDARSFKMSKSRGNVVNPDRIVEDYGADTFRLYEMYMGPLEATKPWNTRDIVGMARFLAAVYRNLVGDEENNKVAVISEDAPGDALLRMTHRVVKKVGDDISAMRFNTAIAELIKLNNELTGLAAVPRFVAEQLVVVLAPFAPHLCEELWEHLGHKTHLSRQAWPVFDESMLVDSSLELPVQVNGKLRDKIVVAADADEAAVFAAAMASEKVLQWTSGKTLVKKIYVPRKMVTLVVKG
jgi:leucyl-tRNA synthetase